MQENNSLAADLDYDDEGIGLDMKKTVARFIDHWKFFGICLLVSLAVTFLYLKTTTPIYKVDATLMIQDPDKGGDVLSSDSKSSLSSLGDLFGSKSSVDNEAQILQTNDLPLKVAREMKLYISYYRATTFSEFELYKNTPIYAFALTPVDSLVPALLTLTLIKLNNIASLNIKEKSAGETFKYSVQFGKPFKTASGDSLVVAETGYPMNEKGDYQISVGTLTSAATGLKHALSVDIPNKQVSTINLELRSPLRSKGTDILLALINEYIRGNITQKNAFADSTIAFIDNRIGFVNDELNHIEKKVQTFKETNKIADIKEQASQVIDNAADNIKDLNQAEVQKEILETSIKYLENENNNSRPVPSILASPDPAFLVILEKYNSMQVEADKMTLSNTDKNPMVINLNEQIANVRKDLLSNLKNQLSAINIGLDKLQVQNNHVNSFIQSAPEIEREYLSLEREQEIKQALFIYLLQKREEVAVTKASNISSSLVIDTPKAAEKPYSPIRSIFYMVALIAGIAVPYLYLLLRDLLNNKVVESKDLTHTGSVLLGEIGHNFSSSNIIFNEKTRSPITEQLRALRTNLQFVLPEANCPVLLITSSTSGEGKSFISINLGLAYAFNGKRVLLMELDLRKPKLSSILKIKTGVGFSNYIISDLTATDMVSPTEASPNLFVFPSGPIPPNPSELLSSPKTKMMIDHLKQNYDIIIIDAAPIGLVTDAQLLVPFADISLYIVRQNYTYKQQTNIIKNLIFTNKIPKLYTIINDVKQKTSSLYGYDQNNGYGYGYGYGYNLAETTPWWKKMLRLHRN